MNEPSITSSEISSERPRVPIAPLAVLALLATLGAAWFLFRTSADEGASGMAQTSTTLAVSTEDAPHRTGTTSPEGAGAAGGTPAAHAFVDEAQCRMCHARVVEAWTGSDHDLAMQPAGEDTVLGDFADARFEDASGVTRFFRRDGGYFVETTGPDGGAHEYPVPYVFGVDPLQQLLLPLEGGRLQALAVAWDARAKRWFSLYPDERIDATDELHWTKAPLNWNFACAECHATDLVRGFDVAENAFHTTWSRLDVGCQACHGPAARHLEWARTSDLAVVGRGFDAPIRKSSRAEVEACARCHARRAPLGDGFDHRHRFLDDYLPATLHEGLYHPDGQIQDEVYEYGSFLQSKMHAKGVRCSDCHDPHGLRPRRPGNTLCTTCHSSAPQPPPHVDVATLQRKNYDSREHHFHEPGTSGSACVDCHMPQKTYMIVDPRRDHAFRIPRPDLSARLGTPDACTACHRERDAVWAAAEIEQRFGKKKRPADFGTALAAGRAGTPGAAEQLLELVRSGEPAIVRATAFELLARYPSRRVLDASAAALSDADGLVRLAALGNFELLGPEERVPAVAPLLADELRAVRLEAARLLASTADEPRLARALSEYEAVQRGLSERPEAHLNLAQIRVERGQPAEAEAELRTAVRLDPAFVPGWVNLAELVRGVRGDAEGEALLREGLRHAPRAAALHHSLGLALVRQQKKVEALTSLALAAELAPDDPQLGYVYAVALEDSGRGEEARSELVRVLATSPWHRDARLALAGYLAAAGDGPGAERERAALAAINPDDPALAPPPR